MEKASTVIQDILSEVLVQSPEQPVQGVDSNTCIRYMNRFMASMDAYGAGLGYTTIISASDDVTIDPAGMDGLIFNTALRLCNSYGIQASPALVMSAKEGRAAMMQASQSQGASQMPYTMPIGSGNEWGYGGITDKFYTESTNVENELNGNIQLEDDTNG